MPFLQAVLSCALRVTPLKTNINKKGWLEDRLIFLLKWSGATHGFSGYILLNKAGIKTAKSMLDHRANLNQLGVKNHRMLTLQVTNISPSDIDGLPNDFPFSPGYVIVPWRVIDAAIYFLNGSTINYLGEDRGKT